MKLNRLRFAPTLLFDFVLLWILLHYGLGGWQSAVYLVLNFAPLSGLLLGLVLFLVLFRSDYRSDIPLFFAGLALGYWGEWWGTTRGLWQYWNGATPPEYLPPLWGIGLLTVYRLSAFLRPLLKRDLPAWLRWCLLSSFLVLPVLAFANSLPLLATVDWSARLDGHFYAGLLLAAFLIVYQFDLRRDFPIYVCGILLGGMYEYFGTSFGEWTYITRETPPLWIAPLWGLACLAMVRLAHIGQMAVARAWQTCKRMLPGKAKATRLG